MQEARDMLSLRVSWGLLDEKSKSLHDSPGEIVIIKNAAARFLFILLGHLKQDLRLKDKRWYD